MAEPEGDALSGLLSSLYAYPVINRNSAFADLGADVGEATAEVLAEPVVLYFAPESIYAELESKASEVAESKAGELAGREIFATVDWSIQSLTVAIQELSDWRALHEALSRYQGAGPQ